jgi:hypothetical protein
MTDADDMSNHDSSNDLETIRQLLMTVARVAERNTNAIDRLAANQQMLQQDNRLIFQRMEAMQMEIRGLQTENRRILELLEQHFSDGHGG